jgi:hypothetical protein
MNPRSRKLAFKGQQARLHALLELQQLLLGAESCKIPAIKVVQRLHGTNLFQALLCWQEGHTRICAALIFVF